MHPHLEGLNTEQVCAEIYTQCIKAVISRQDRSYYTYGLASEYAALLGEYWYNKKPPKSSELQSLRTEQDALRETLKEVYSHLKQKIACLKPYKEAIDAVQHQIYQTGKLPDSEHELKSKTIEKLYELINHLSSKLSGDNPPALDVKQFHKDLKALRVPYVFEPSRIKARVLQRIQCFLGELVYGIGIDTTRDTIQLAEHRKLVDALENSQALKGKVWPKFKIEEHFVHTTDSASSTKTGAVEYLVFKHETLEDRELNKRPWIIMFPGASSPFASVANGLRMRDLATSTGCHVMMMNNRAWSIQKQSIASYAEVNHDIKTVLSDFLQHYDNNLHAPILDTLTLYGHCGGGMVAQLAANHLWKDLNRPPKLILDRNPPSFQVVVKSIIHNLVDVYVTPKSVNTVTQRGLFYLLLPIHLLLTGIAVGARYSPKPILKKQTQQALKTAVWHGLKSFVSLPLWMTPIVKGMLLVLTSPLYLLLNGLLWCCAKTSWAKPLTEHYLEYPTALKRHFSIIPKHHKHTTYEDIAQDPTLEQDFLLSKRASFQNAHGSHSIRPWRFRIKQFLNKWISHEEVKKHPNIHSLLSKIKMYTREAKIVKAHHAKRDVDPHYVITTGIHTRCHQPLSTLIKDFAHLSISQLCAEPLTTPEIMEQCKSAPPWIQSIFQEGIELKIFEIDKQRALLKKDILLAGELIKEAKNHKPSP